MTACKWHVVLAVSFAVTPVLLGAQERPDTTLSLVSGRVIDHESGASVPGATVSLGPTTPGLSTPGSRSTGEEGLFRFEGIVSGGYAVTVTALGYQPLADSIYVTPASDVRLAVYLSASPIELEPIVAVSPRRPPFMDGFEARRAHDRTHTGFFTREDIEELHPRDISDLVRTVPGTYNEMSLFGQRIRVAGDVARPRPCSPNVFVNGLFTPWAEYDYIYPPEDIEAVELYTTVHETPAQFQMNAPNICGALVIWLREPDPWEEPEGTSWRALAGWVGALGALMLLVR